MKRTFRPSARLICTIGEDIIKDMHAAVIEMVKNAYDADANKVLIVFEATEDKKLLLSIQDDGHGMNEDVVLNKWLVPSTSDKLHRRTSPKGRVMQGRKGIGRFAAAILGEKLKLETISENITTSLSINWNDFVDNKYLDEIFIDISTLPTNSENGTLFRIEGSADRLELWNDSAIEYLIKELKKLITPMGYMGKDVTKDTFEITVQFKNFTSEKFKNETIKIAPLPILDYYDYRISGRIFQNGENTLVYHNKDSGTVETASDFNFHLKKETEKFTGDISVDFRIFDRDPEAIESLIYEMFNAGENRLGRNEAKKLLNDIAGISICRNNFRIRPYGDVNYDWLSLDKQRVQNPAQKIGANQISGLIEIQDEEVSNLVEKSARDGLKEDAYYDGLVSVINQLLIYVESKRYSYRKKTGKGRKNYLFSKQLSILTDFSAVKNKVNSAMEKANMDVEVVKDVNDFIDNDINEKIKIAQELEQQIAMYQGQATLGKIMDVVMHEARKPLQWINNQTVNMEKAYSSYCNNNDTEELKRVIRIIKETPEQLMIISALFKRLNILATRKRSAMTVFSLKDTVTTAVEIFHDEIKRKDIQLCMNIDEDYSFKGWREDILAALANIIENAVYWVDYAKTDKKIEISLIVLEDSVTISIWNNGPKIIKDLLEGDALFDPGISGKVTEYGTGTGLGLPIAGEAVDRNRGQIKVIDAAEGAKFLITLPKEEEK